MGPRLHAVWEMHRFPSPPATCGSFPTAACSPQVLLLCEQSLCPYEQPPPSTATTMWAISSLPLPLLHKECPPTGVAVQTASSLDLLLDCPAPENPVITHRSNQGSGQRVVSGQEPLGWTLHLVGPMQLTGHQLDSLVLHDFYILAIISP